MPKSFSMHLPGHCTWRPHVCCPEAPFLALLPRPDPSTLSQPQLRAPKPAPAGTPVLRLGSLCVSPDTFKCLHDRVAAVSAAWLSRWAERMRGGGEDRRRMCSGQRACAARQCRCLQCGVHLHHCPSAVPFISINRTPRAAAGRRQQSDVRLLFHSHICRLLGPGGPAGVPGQRQHSIPGCAAAVPVPFTCFNRPDALTRWYSCGGILAVLPPCALVLWWWSCASGAPAGCFHVDLIH